jgi:hypothetical protein
MLRPSWIADCDKMTCHHCRNVFTFVVRRVRGRISWRFLLRMANVIPMLSESRECRMYARLQHHCRCCGNIFCDYCSQFRRAIPKFDYTTPVRVCEKCDKTCEQAGIVFCMTVFTPPTSCGAGPAAPTTELMLWSHALQRACSGRSVQDCHLRSNGRNRGEQWEL